MPSLPPRDNRVLLTVGALKEEIQTGKLSSTLPGERALAKRLQVSRKTLRKAIDLLEKDLWISTAQHGCRRQILVAPKKTSEQEVSSLRGKNVVVMAPRPLPEMGGIERLFQSRLTQFCEKSGVTLRHRHLDVRHMKRPAYRLEEFIQQNPADVYLLQHSTQEIQKWFDKQSIPSMVLGDRWQGISIPAVAGDHEATAVHIAGLLQRNGHKSVAMLYPQPPKRGLEIFVSKLGEVAPDMELTLIGYEENPESASRSAEALLAESSRLPTAIITPNMFSTIAVSCAAGRLGLRIPEDISLVSLSQDEALQYLQPKIAAYDIQWEDFTKAVFKSLSDMLLHPDSRVIATTLIMPDFQLEGSLGAAS